MVAELNFNNIFWIWVAHPISRSALLLVGDGLYPNNPRTTWGQFVPTIHLPTPPLCLDHPFKVSERFLFPEKVFFFLCCFREGGETGQSAGHLLALPVPWPYGILGMYYSSLHSYNLPGFRLRQDRRENDYPRENTHKNIKYLTQTDQKLLHFTDESWKNNTFFWLMNTSELTWLELRIIPVWLQQPEAMKVNDLIWRGLPLSAARCKLNWSTHCTHIWCSVRTCTGTYVTFRHMFR